MRINNITAGPVNHRAGAFSFSGTGEIYDWAKDSDFSIREQAADEFVKSGGASDEILDKGIEDFFEERDTREDRKPSVLKIKKNSKDPRDSFSFIVEAGAIVTAFYLAGTILISGVPVLGQGIKDLMEQGKLENRFESNPNAVAEELITSTGFDYISRDNFFGSYGVGSFSSIISGETDDELLNGAPLGPDSKLEYSINNFVTFPATTYEANLDIDGDGNPEISLFTGGMDGRINVDFDYDSDGVVDESTIYSVYSEGSKNNNSTPSLVSHS